VANSIDIKKTRMNPITPAAQNWYFNEPTKEHKTLLPTNNTAQSSIPVISEYPGAPHTTTQNYGSAIFHNQNAPMSSSCHIPLTSIYSGIVPTQDVKDSVRDSFQRSANDLFIRMYTRHGLITNPIPNLTAYWDELGELDRLARSNGWKVLFRPCTVYDKGTLLGLNEDTAKTASGDKCVIGEVHEGDPWSD
jgi:hypothetical protein